MLNSFSKPAENIKKSYKTGEKVGKNCRFLRENRDVFSDVEKVNKRE